MLGSLCTFCGRVVLDVDAVVFLLFYKCNTTVLSCCSQYTVTAYIIFAPHHQYLSHSRGPAYARSKRRPGMQSCQ